MSKNKSSHKAILYRGAIFLENSELCNIPRILVILASGAETAYRKFVIGYLACPNLHQESFPKTCLDIMADGGVVGRKTAVLQRERGAIAKLNSFTCNHCLPTRLQASGLSNKV